MDTGKFHGRDGTDDAVGLALDEAQPVGRRRDDVASFLVREFGEETDLFGRHRHVAGDRLTYGTGRSDGFEPPQYLCLAFDQIRPGMQRANPLARPRRGPAALPQRLARRLHRAVHDRRVGDRAGAVNDPVGRSANFQLSFGGHEGAADMMVERQVRGGGIEAQ